MYPVSATFKDYIKRNTVSFSWHGTIVDTDENSYAISDENIVQNSGRITKRCSTNALSIGTACASELEMDLYLDVDRYKLFGAVVTLYFTLNMGSATEDVPMGVYIINECDELRGKLSIIAYDNMVKFDDKKYSPKGDTTVKTPYTWLLEACTECGVTLGMTEAQIKALPNGERKTGYADVTGGIITYRDLICRVATYLCSYLYIGRDGKLYLGMYTNTAIDTITPSFRYSSDFSDYRTTYNGINHTYKEDGIQEYTSNDNEEGLVLDIGTNPFLQFTDDDNRMDALQAIIDAWDDVYYVPYKVDMPIVPYYDQGDVIAFTGNQATTDDIGAITEVVYSFGGKMSIKCVGENPRLITTQDRFTKVIAGLNYTNGQEVGGKEFWLIGMTNSEQITVGSTEIQVAEIEYNQSTYGQQLEMVLTIDSVLSATATVSVRVTVDDDTDLEMSVVEKRFKGERGFYCSNPQQVFGIGVHHCKVYMTVTDSPTTVGELY